MKPTRSEQLFLILVLFVMPVLVGAAIVHSVVDIVRGILAAFGAAA